MYLWMCLRVYNCAVCVIFMCIVSVPYNRHGMCSIVAVKAHTPPIPYTKTTDVHLYMSSAMLKVMIHSGRVV
ncbi:hypothetical protein EON63_18990 [archaeon]|nr:MAG: hypothetical protein EON63_18990 [archaeon]